MLKRWEELPVFLQVPEVRPYYEILKRKQISLLFKRIFDFVLALLLLVILAVPMFLIMIWIKMDSPGTALFRQERVTIYGRRFYIHKFRTMIKNADQIGANVTIENDKRITKAGRKLRRLRLDELPQVIDVLNGNMSFVGTRPEVMKYVEQYCPEFRATLLLPAGITSEASIRFKSEDKWLREAESADRIYLEEILPKKMQWNLESIRKFSFLREIWIMFRTIAAVCGRDHE